MMVKKKFNLHQAKQNLQKDLNKFTGKVSHSIRSFDTDTYKIISGDNIKNRRIILLPREGVKKKENQSNHSNNLKKIKLISPEDLDTLKQQRSPRDKKIQTDKNEEEKVVKEEVKSAFEILIEPDSSNSHSTLKFQKAEKSKESTSEASKESLYDADFRKNKIFDAGSSNKKGANNNGKIIDSTDFEENHSKSRKSSSSYRHYYDSKYSPRSTKRSGYRRRTSDEENCPCCGSRKCDQKTDGFIQQMGTLEKLLSIDPEELRLLSNIISMQNNEKAKVEVVKVVEREKPCCAPLTQYVPAMSSGCFSAQPATIFPAIYQPASVMPSQPQQYYCNEMIQPPSYFSHASSLSCPPNVYNNCYCCCEQPMYRVI